MNVRDQLQSSRILAVLRLTPDSPDPLLLAERLVSAGVAAVECTMDSPDVFVTIEHLLAELDSTVIIGAGTVTSREQIRRVADIGARFVVSPHTDEALIEEAKIVGIEPIPGVLSSTEVQRARAAGATILKLFPAEPLGVDYLRTIRAPFHDVDWIPTGGIALEDVGEWLDAGALCVGVGASLRSTASPELAVRELARLHRT